MSKINRKYFSQQFLPVWLIAGGVVILLVAVWAWMFWVQPPAERVFNGMLEQSLRTNGVTVEATDQNQQSKTQYWLQYSLGGQSQAHSLTTIEQNGSTVTTEIIGTSDYDYTRYADINTVETDKQGNVLDVSNIEGVWAQSQQGGNNLLAQAALGLTLPFGAMPVPFGNLTPEARKVVLEQMQTGNVYQVDYEKVEKKQQDGRLQYVYPVKLHIVAYATLMKKFAQQTGLANLDNLDPNQYSGSAPLELKLTVDARSKHLVSVEVESSKGKYTQEYTGYDIPTNEVIPQDFVSTTELQKRLQELQVR